MLLVQFPNIILLLLLCFLIFFCLLLPNLSLDMVSFDLLLLPFLLILNLLQQIVLSSYSLLFESFLSFLLILLLSLFPCKILGQNTFVLFFLLGLMVLDHCFCHHVHKLSLPLLTICHLICSFLLLKFDQSCVLLSRFNLPLSLFLILYPLLLFVALIFLQHCSQTSSFLLDSLDVLLFLILKLPFNLFDHSLIKISLLFHLLLLPHVLILELLVS